MLFSFLYICLQLIQNYASSFSHIRFIIRRKRDTHYYEMTITLPFHCNIIFHPRHSSTLDVHQISPFCGGDFLGVMRYFRKLYAVFLYTYVIMQYIRKLNTIYSYTCGINHYIRKLNTISMYTCGIMQYIRKLNVISSYTCEINHYIRKLNTISSYTCGINHYIRKLNTISMYTCG